MTPICLNWISSPAAARPGKCEIRQLRESSPRTPRASICIDTLSVGVDRIQRNFEPLQRQVERWRKTQITHNTARLILYSAFVDGNLEATRSLLPEVQRLYFEPRSAVVAGSDELFFAWSTILVTSAAVRTCA